MVRLIVCLFLFLCSIGSSSYIIDISFASTGLPVADNKMSTFEKNLRSTLGENPEIILNILKEYNQDVLKIIVDASQADTEGALQQYRDLWESQKKNKAQSIVEKNSPYWGNEKAKVVMVAYSDFLCPYCAVSAEYMKAFLAKNSNVRYVFKNFSKKPLSRKAYGYLMAVWESDRSKAGTFMYTVFNSMEELAQKKEAFLDQTVKSLGLNVEKIRKRSETFSKLMDEDSKEGEKFDIQGTPTIIVNGKYTIVGAVPEEILEAAAQFAMQNK